TAFLNGETIPVIHSCDGKDQSPPLSFKNVPPKAVSLALVMDDPDAPNGTFVHWIAWNIDPKAEGLPGEVKAEDTSMVQGTNSGTKIGYMGPCPPKGPPHHYFFKLYALNTKLNLSRGASMAEFNKAIEGKVIEETKLMGTFQRMP
ncbi:MAG TPA: YbhB/YbcL family Raf kinase inhibitor-like protein, partial [Myxococcota bacterium]|nr:YbhB/YbcL family Raf kinase inhibitor-like protein [Myxococcota bacterium]